MTLFECVPNLSEGRDPELVHRAVEAAEACGVRVAHRTADPDHHRSVLTWFGSAGALVEAADAVLATLIAERELASHRGIHPRTGLLDVVPFVPLVGFVEAPELERADAAWLRREICGSTTGAAVSAARRCARELSRRRDIPCLLYEQAASRTERTDLAAHRRHLRGVDDGLPAEWPPDTGPAHPHPRAGVVLVGARRPLVAFNLDLATDDVRAARAIAARIRARTPGGLPGVKALGLALERRRCAQVSVNLVDASRTSLPELVERVESEAGALGVAIRRAELIGLLTHEAAAGADAGDLHLDRLAAEDFVEHHLGLLADADR